MGGEGGIRGWVVRVGCEGRIEFLAANQQRVFDVSEVVSIERVG